MNPNKPVQPQGIEVIDSGVDHTPPPDGRDPMLDHLAIVTPVMRALATPTPSPEEAMGNRAISRETLGELRQKVSETSGKTALKGSLVAEAGQRQTSKLKGSLAERG